MRPLRVLLGLAYEVVDEPASVARFLRNNWPARVVERGSLVETRIEEVVSVLDRVLDPIVLKLRDDVALPIDDLVLLQVTQLVLPHEEVLQVLVAEAVVTSNELVLSIPAA
uniref:Uncharacterized protein n=1 Tax=Strombidium inclinatum TaxID=197538 RepID=A0A7S3IDY6_9SPIT